MIEDLQDFNDRLSDADESDLADLIAEVKEMAALLTKSLPTPKRKTLMKTFLMNSAMPPRRSAH